MEEYAHRTALPLRLGFILVIGRSDFLSRRLHANCIRCVPCHLPAVARIHAMGVLKAPMACWIRCRIEMMRRWFYAV